MRWPLLALLALASCGGTPTTAGTWSGDVTPKSPTAVCARTRGTAQIMGDHLTFAPNEATWILSGTAEPGGHATAERIQIGANKQPFETRFEGTWSQTSLSGTYTTPRCVFDVSLTRR